MSVLTITSENYEEKVIKESRLVILDFWAEWCMPCRIMSPIIDEIAEEVKEDVVVGKVNVEEEQNLSREFEIVNIPTIVILKNGQVVKKFIGVQDKETILKEIK